MSMAYWNTPTTHRKANQQKEQHKLVESDEDVPSDDATHDDDIGDAAPTPKHTRRLQA